MYPTQHVALTAVALVPLRARGLPLPELALFAAGSVLIDVDHYLSYAAKSGDWSLTRAYHWHAARVPRVVHRRPKFYRPAILWDRYRPFHALLPIALLFALGFADRAPGLSLLKLLRPLACGALFHRACDYSLEVFEYRPGVPRDLSKE